MKNSNYMFGYQNLSEGMGIKMEMKMEKVLFFHLCLIVTRECDSLPSGWLPFHPKQNRMKKWGYNYLLIILII